MIPGSLTLGALRHNKQWCPPWRELQHRIWGITKECCAPWRDLLHRVWDITLKRLQSLRAP